MLKFIFQETQFSGSQHWLHEQNPRQPLPTSETIGVIAWVLIREASLIGEGIDDLHPDLAPTAVRSGGRDRVADAAIHQPAGAALV